MIGYNISAMNKAEEFRILKQFLCLFGLSGYIDLSKPDQERPDMIIELEGKKIGLELTKLFTGGRPKYLSHQARFITALCQELNKQTAPYVGLIVGNMSTDYTPIPTKDFVALISIIMRYITQAKNKYESIPYAGLLIKTGDKRIDSFWLRIIKANGINRIMIGFAAQTTSYPFVYKEIQRCLDAKESKISQYLPCNEHWLIIHTNSFHPLQNWGANNQFIQGNIFRSTFNRVFIYDEGNKQIDELVLSATS